MRRFILCALALVVAWGASAQESVRDEVVVNGYAERKVTPDKFTVAITISETDSKGRISLDEQERSIIKSLRAEGFDTDEALRLKNNYSSYMRRGALATRDYELVVHGAERLSVALATLEELNLHSVSLSRATCTNLDAIREELRREAMRDAKRNAEVLAEAIEQEVGSCTYILDNNSNGDVYFNVNSGVRIRGISSFDDLSEAYAKKAEPMEFAETTISHTIQAKFQLLP